MRSIWMLVALAACGHGKGGGQPPFDASEGGEGKVVVVDAPPPLIDAPVGPGNARSHTLFINTEGVTVTMSATDDATTNKSTIPTPASSTLLGFRMGDANRATRIAEIVNSITTTLAPFDVAIVQTRPAAGPYDMVVLTDSSPTALGLPNGVGAVTPTSCNMTDSVVSFVFGPYNPQGTDHDFIARNIIAMFGIEAGVPASKVAGDCMCLADAACGANLTAPCTIGGPGTTIDGNAQCGVAGTTMDERALMFAAWGSSL